MSDYEPTFPETGAWKRFTEHWEWWKEVYGEDCENFYGTLVRKSRSGNSLDTVD